MRSTEKFFQIDELTAFGEIAGCPPGAEHEHASFHLVPEKSKETSPAADQGKARRTFSPGETRWDLMIETGIGTRYERTDRPAASGTAAQLAGMEHGLCLSCRCSWPTI